MNANPLSSPTEQFRLFIVYLCGAIRYKQTPEAKGWLIALAWQRAWRIGALFATLAARVQAGTFRPRKHNPRHTGRPASPSRPRALRTPPSGPAAPPAGEHVPTGFRWLRRHVWQAGSYGGQLEYLSRNPEMLALLEAAPQQFGRLLRPLYRMLGAVPPPCLIAPKRPPRAKPPVAIAAEAGPAPEKPLKQLYGRALNRYLASKRRPFPGETVVRRIR